jgi:peptidoglycan hydrolase-like protein with peptidoglycan-binding domain
MILLKWGTVLPTVTTAQILLRRHAPNAEITADGWYGNKTTSAVWAFQKYHSLGQDGIVGRFTWEEFMTVSGLQTIDVVDATDDPELEAVDIRNAGGDPIVLSGMSNGVTVAMDQVVGRANGAGSVALLRFHGHGAPGDMGVSSGKGEGVSILSDIAVGNFSKILPALMKIKHIFCKFGSVQLHGCKVAGGVDGPILLNKLATLWGVPVTGGVMDQKGGGKTTFVFEGPTITAFPSGGDLKGWSKGVQTEFGNVSVEDEA